MVVKTGLPQLDNLVTNQSLTIETTSITLGFAALSLIFFFYQFVKKSNQFVVVDAIDSKAGLNFKDGRAPDQYHWSRFLQEAARKHSKPFTIKFPDLGETVILPPKYIEDVKNNKDMSLSGSSIKDFPMNVGGFEPMKNGSGNLVFHDAVRIKLTQALTFFTDDLSDEANIALPQIFPDSREWKEVQLYPSLLQLVTRLSSLIFLGRDFEHIKEWNAISASYTVNMFQAARVWRSWNRFIRPFVHLFLPEFRTLRNQVAEARRIIEPEVRARQLRRTEAEKNGTAPRKSLDSVDWFEDVRKPGQKFDFVSGELLLSVVAIHTTSSTLTNTLLDICANPTIIAPLREEIIRVVKEDDGLQRTTLHKLKLMDSVLKESQRLHPLGQATLRRRVERTTKLHDGTVLKRGTFTLSAPLANYDQDVYDDPYTFVGDRFLQKRQVPGEENKWQFAATQSEHMGFGHGIHACPGRFFASNELKVALMHLLLKYDWKLKDGEGRPESLELGIETSINPGSKLMYRTRTPEVDL